MRGKYILFLISILAIFFLACFFVFKFPQRPFKLGLDLQGGSHLVYQADLSNIEKEDYSSAMAGLRDIIERRVNLFGVVEPIVQTQITGEDYRLIVELAGVKDVSEAIKMIGQTPYLEFREPRPDYDEFLEQNKELIEKGEIQIDEFFQPSLLTGRYLKKAELNFDPNTYEPSVSILFDDEGAKIFEEMTQRNLGNPLAIYIDNDLISAPIVQEKISGGKAQITGRFTVDEARRLVTNLNAGALPIPINLISQQTIGPTLGEDSLQKSLKAGIFGFLAIIVFMIVFYRLPGLLASFSLLIYVVLVLSLFKMIPVTLTLAGIAGFILSMGMAVDANVLVFSRMREERREQKSFETVIEEGFRRAWPSIRDGNLTTIITAIILFGFGSSFVKGFAFTLVLGNLISIFTAVIVTKLFFKIFIDSRFEKWPILWK